VVTWWPALFVARTRKRIVDDDRRHLCFLELLRRTMQVIKWPLHLLQPLNDNRQSVGPSVFPQKPKSETNYSASPDSWPPRVEPPYRYQKYPKFMLGRCRRRKRRSISVRPNWGIWGLILRYSRFYLFKVQHEQLVMARLIKAKRMSTRAPAERKILKAPKAQLHLFRHLSCA